MQLAYAFVMSAGYEHSMAQNLEPGRTCRAYQPDLSTRDLLSKQRFLVQRLSVRDLFKELCASREKWKRYPRGSALVVSAHSAPHASQCQAAFRGGTGIDRT
jgi:hypothetical protein